MPEKTAIYRLFDSDGALLYVGISNNPRKRWTVHAIRKSWWHLVANTEVEWLASREEAEAREREAVTQEHPRFDNTHRNGSGWRTHPLETYVDPRTDEIELRLREMAASSSGAPLPRPSGLARALGTSAITIRGLLYRLEREGVVRHRDSRWFGTESS